MSGAQAIRILGQLWLEHARFVRQGPDLLLIGNDGQQILVTDYFRLEPPPALVTDYNATFAPDLVGKLAGPEAPGQFAQAAAGSVAQPIGRIETIAGPVEITRADGTRVTISKGDAVFSGDVVETGPKGAVSLILADDSVFSLADNGRVVLDEMVYDPAQQTGKLGLSLVTGVMSFVSGQIAKTDPDAMVLSTPIATVGIRGTTGSLNSGVTLSLVLTPDPDGTVGEITVTTAQGVQTINTPLSGVNVSANGAIVSITVTADQLAQMFPSVLVLRDVVRDVFGFELSTGNVPTQTQEGTEGQREAFVPQEVIDRLTQESEIGDQLAQMLSQIDTYPAFVAYAPPININFLSLVPQEVLLQAQALTVSYAAQAAAIAGSISTLGSLTSTQRAKEAASTEMLTQLTARANENWRREGLTDNTEREQINTLITGPLTSFGTSSALGATAYGIMTVTATLLKTLGSTTSFNVDAVIALLNSASSALIAASAKSNLIADAVDVAAPIINTVARNSARAEANVAQKRSAVETALFGSGSRYQTAVQDALATLNTSNGTNVSLADLETLLDDVLDALNDALDLVENDTTFPEIKVAIEKTILIATAADTAADWARKSIVDYEDGNAGTSNAQEARNAATNALAQTQLAKDYADDLEDEVPLREVLATVHPSIVSQVLTALDTVDTADQNVAVAVATIRAGSKITVDLSTLEAKLGALQNDTDDKIAAAAAARQEATDAAETLVAARVLLAGLLVDEAIALARAEAYEDARDAAAAKLTTDLDDVFPDSVNLGPLDRSKSITELRTEINASIGTNVSPGDLLENALVTRALADLQPTNVALDATADLAEQVLANARAALDFVNQLYALFNDARAAAQTAYDEALDEYEEVHEDADAARADIVPDSDNGSETAYEAAQRELSEALDAMAEAADGRTDVAVKQMELNIAATAKRVEMLLTLEFAVEDALAAAENAQLARDDADWTEADSQADEAEELLAAATATANSAYAPSDAADFLALVEYYAYAARAWANNQTPDDFSSFSAFATVDEEAAALAAVTAAAVEADVRDQHLWD